MLAFSFSWTEYWLFMLALILISVALTSLCGSVPGVRDPHEDDVQTCDASPSLRDLCHWMRHQIDAQTSFCSLDCDATRMRTL